VVEYERIYLEIAQGFSPFGGTLVKHLTLQDNAKINSFRESTLKRYLKEGYKSEEDILKILDKKGLWTESDEKDLKQKTRELEGFKKALLKISAPKMKRDMEKSIESHTKEVLEKTKKRSGHLGLTAEVAANNSSFDMDVCLSLAGKDEKPIWPWEEFESIDDSELERYYKILAEHRTLFSYKNVSNLALQGFFINLFYLLPEEQPYLLFNKPLHTFTFWQTTLCRTASRVRNIFTHMKGIPDDVMEDAEKLFEYADSGGKDAKKTAEEAAKEWERNKGKSANMIKNPNSIA
jgi:hypothetical protein